MQNEKTMGKELQQSAVKFRLQKIEKLLGEADSGDYRHVATVGQYAELDNERKRLQRELSGE